MTGAGPVTYNIIITTLHDQNTICSEAASSNDGPKKNLCVKAQCTSRTWRLHKADFNILTLQQDGVKEPAN